MELLIIAMTVAFICRDPSGTIKAATSYKRAQIERERTRNPRGRHPGHRALRNYLGTVWENQWAAAAERYPERMRAAQARRARAWKRMQERAGARWDDRFPPTEKTREERAKAFDKKLAKELDEEREGEELAKRLAEEERPTAPVVDLDAERRRREGADEPVAGADPDTPEEGTKPMAVNLSDATSLRAHLAALREHATYQDKTCTAKEQLAAGMKDAEVGGSTIAAVDASRAASAHAAAMARAAADALEDANMSVAEARTGSPDAGSGDYYERR